MPDRLFAIGDIHGCFDALRRLVEDEICLAKNDTLVLLGDYIDRGPNSKQVIDYILKLTKDNFRVIPLRGNHEEMLLDAHDNENNLSLWLYNGGNKTLLSFGITSPDDFKPEYITFFRNLKYYHVADDFIFVHAGFDDAAENPFSNKHAMVWECRKKYKHPELKNKTIIHGHCATTEKKFDKKIKKNKKVISVDTGCVYKNYPGFGNLTAIEIYTKQVFKVACK